MPIISFVASGAGAIIRLFGPEYIGGMGDIGANIDAEVARTGLSADEIGPKVYISHIVLLDRLNNFVSKDSTAYRGETHSGSWASRNA